MIKFLKGDLLKAQAQALVNTVNTVGVMGKGIALQFKEAFPYNNKIYIQACKNKELEPGKLLMVKDNNLLYGEKLIINFPTKKHWRHPSKYEYIASGLISLRKLIINEKIKSIAIPPLGAGNGGLEWEKVKPMITDALGDLPIEIQIFEPNAHIKELLQKQDQKRQVNLSPARASLLYGLFAFESFGEYSSLFSANKIAYFLQRLGQDLKLNFTRNHYGPYAIGVEKVLYHLNGVFLKGLEQGQARPFEPLKLNYEKWEMVERYVSEMDEIERDRLKSLLQFLKNFTSELSLEVLATVDFVLNQNPDYTIDEVVKSIGQWNTRKAQIFKIESITRAYQHLNNFNSLLVQS
nr:macro domain-containing protein [Sphingobacterium multivorum]